MNAEDILNETDSDESYSSKASKASKKEDKQEEKSQKSEIKSKELSETSKEEAKEEVESPKDLQMPSPKELETEEIKFSREGASRERSFKRVMSPQQREKRSIASEEDLDTEITKQTGTPPALKKNETVAGRMTT